MLLKRNKTLLICALIFLSFVGCGQKQLGQEARLAALDKISTEMSRAEVESFFMEMQSHQLCLHDETTSVELYLFGSTDLNTASVIYIVYNEIDGTDTVMQIAAPAPEFLERPAFNDCHQIDES